jgi:hypothetical protein
MPFETPTQTFDATEHAKNKVLRANQLEELIVQQFKSAYEDFWGVTENSGSRYSIEQMQQVLEAMPMSTAVDILTDAASLVTYIDQSYPEALPERYKNAAFQYSISEAGLVLNQLSPMWEPEIEEEE